MLGETSRRASQQKYAPAPSIRLARYPESVMVLCDIEQRDFFVENGAIRPVGELNYRVGFVRDLPGRRHIPYRKSQSFGRDRTRKVEMLVEPGEIKRLKSDPDFVKKYLEGNLDTRDTMRRHHVGSTMRTGTIEEIRQWELSHYGKVIS